MTATGCASSATVIARGLLRTKRYPWIVEAALKNRQKRFVIDGAVVILGLDGISDFNARQ
jgi:hypothetical protein